MDKVRFGRALGYGARHAARAVAQAVDAATAPNTTTRADAATRPAPAPAPAPKPTAEQPAPRKPPRMTQGGHAVTMAKVAGKSVLGPVTKFSSVLWLQVTGTFYALIAVVLGQALWRHRAELHLPASSTGAQKVYFLAVVLLVFAYFAVTNFVRAHRRERR